MEEQHLSSSRIHWIGESSDDCNYCNSEASSIVNGMWAYSLNVLDYQNLIDHGWRRSGHYLYKPINERTCCPSYTIRCDVGNFHPTKSHKKVLKNMNKFLLRGKTVKNLCKAKKEEWNQFLDNHLGEMPAPYSINDICCKNDDASSKPFEEYSKERKASKEVEAKEIGSLPGVSGIRKAKERKISEKAESKKIDILPGVSATRKGSQEQTKEEFPSSSETMAETLTSDLSTACTTVQNISINKIGSTDRAYRKKAKLIRRENKYQKLVSQGYNEKEVQERLDNSRVIVQSSSQLEDFILNMDTGKNKLEVKLVRTSPKSKEYKNTASESFLLYKRYQIAVHADEPNELTTKSYERFLVDSPLDATASESDPIHGYGSFHQQYWINDTLIAVGVIDILPHCVSSVYFFYDPDLKVLSLGTYGALREIFFTQKIKLSVPSIQFYYMGYYIHSCPKMKYKRNFPPSYLLCSETYTWHPIEICLPKLDSSKYSRFEEDDLD